MVQVNWEIIGANDENSIRKHQKGVMGDFTCVDTGQNGAYKVQEIKLEIYGA